jgi:hypothetical protein
MAKQDDYVRYTIRVPATLYARVQEAAGEKSVNAEIIERLEEVGDVGSTLRRLLPKGLVNRVEIAAAANGRSVIEEIVQALEKAYPIPNLTFGEHMAHLRETLADPSNDAPVLTPILKALLRSYEKFAERDPEWVNKHPLYGCPPGMFPTNFRALEDQQE